MNYKSFPYFLQIRWRYVHAGAAEDVELHYDVEVGGIG